MEAARPKVEKTVISPKAQVTPPRAALGGDTFSPI